MLVVDEEEREFRQDDMEIDNELLRIMLQEGAEMGEMGDLVVDSSSSSLFSGEKLSKRRGWKKSLKCWWRKV